MQGKADAKYLEQPFSRMAPRLGAWVLKCSRLAQALKFISRFKLLRVQVYQATILGGGVLETPLLRSRVGLARLSSNYMCLFIIKNSINYVYY